MTDKNAKHTPGPWKKLFTIQNKRTRIGRWYLVSYAEPNNPRNIVLEDRQNFTKQISPAEANASLISAAPELLEALLAVLPNTPGWNARDFAGRPWLVAAEAAISKAKGEQP